MTQESTTRSPSFSAPIEKKEPYETDSILSMASTSTTNTENHKVNLEYDIQIHYKRENPNKPKIYKDQNDLFMVKIEDHYTVFDSTP